MNELLDEDKRKHDFKEIKAEIDATPLMNRNKKIVSELKKDDVKSIISKLLNDGELWIPNYDLVKEQTNEIYGGSIASIIPHVVYSSRHNKPVHVLKDSEVMDYKLSQHYRLFIQFQDFLLQDINQEIILKRLKESDFYPFFSRPELKKHFPFIKRALHHHFKEDYLSAVSILIPRIEGILRDCLKLLGLEVLYKTGKGGYKEKTISRLLDQTSRVNKIIEPDVIEYIRHYLVRDMGVNNRNEIAHALMDEAGFKSTLSLRLIFLALIFFNPQA